MTDRNDEIRKMRDAEVEALLKRLARHRAMVDNAEAIVAAKAAALMATKEQRELDEAQDRVRGLKSDMANVDHELRAKLVKFYGEDPEVKKWVDGLAQVKVGEVPVYADEEAIAWAFDHNHRGIVRLDTTAFKKMAKVLRPGFVTFDQTVTPNIARDLSALLPKAAVDDTEAAIDDRRKEAE